MGRQTAQQPVDVGIEVERELRAKAPDYDNWTPNDFTRLGKRTADFIWGRIANRLPYENFIPKSFFRDYGDQARPTFARALMLAQEDNNNLGTVANGTIRGILQQAYSLTKEQLNKLDLDKPITVRLANGSQVSVAPGEAVTYLMAQAMNSGNTTKTTVEIPSYMMRQIVGNNSQVIKQPWGNIAPKIGLGDEEAYGVGYAIGKGYSANIGAVFATGLPPASQVCAALPRLEGAIFNPVPDQAVKTGLYAGYGRAQVNCGDGFAQIVPDVRSPAQNVR